MYPKFYTNILQSLHGQPTGIHFFTAALKAFKVAKFFISDGTFSHNFGPKYAILLEPYLTLCLKGTTNSDWFLNSYLLQLLVLKILLKMLGDNIL